MNKKVYKIPFGNFFTRAYVVGDLSKGIPLILLHGGPGGCIEKYEPLEKLADKGIPLIFYDQIGCGYSRVPAGNEKLWNFNLFLDELDNLIKFFGLTRFNLLGHSWGGMLALEWVTHRNAGNLNKLILFSTLPSTRIWNEEHLRMIEHFPNDEKEALINEYKGISFDKNLNRLGIKRFYKDHVGKKSKDLYAFKRKHFPRLNREIYGKMWGNSELFGTGTLKNWNVESLLKTIDKPTLILSGKYDESSPKMNELMNKEIKNSKWVLLEHSHHIGYIEEHELVVETISKFLD